MKRTLAHAFAVLVLVGMTVPVLAGGVNLILGTPFPYGRTDGGTLGQKKGGWQVGLAYSTHMVDSVDLVFEGAYGELPNAVETTWLSPMKVLEVSANLKVRMNDKYKVVPYALLGLGVAEINFLADIPEAKITLSSTEVTKRIGGGFDVLASNRWNFYAEALVWNSYYVTMIPVGAGIRFIL